MPRDGLVATPKTVSRGGKTFQETYWVKTAEIAKDVKEKGAENAVEKLGGDPKVANLLAGDWAGSSFSEGAIQLRAGVGKAFGIDVSRDMDRLAAKGIDAKMLKQNAKAGEKTAATVKALAHASQSAHEGDTVTLYRGIGAEQAKALKETGKLTVDSVSSFTESHEIAKNFGGAAVVKITVPKSSIVMSWRASRHLEKNEQEVVVASHGGFDVKPGDIL